VARGREVPLQVHLDDGIPLVLLHVHEHAVTEDPGVVDEDVESPERLDRGVDEPLRTGELRHVLAVGHGLAAERLDLGDDAVRRVGVGAFSRQRGPEIVDDDLRSGAGEGQRVLAADPAPRPGDDRDLPFQVRHALLLVKALSP